MTKSDDALNAFRNGFTCSAAVFSAFSEDLGLNLAIPEEYAKARDNRSFFTLCPALVGDAATILEKILDDAER